MIKFLVPILALLIMVQTSFAQAWIELYNSDIPTLRSNVPQVCSPTWGKQYHCWPWHPEPIDAWEFSSSENIDIDSVSVYLLSEWSAGNGTQQCPSGWWDGMIITTNAFSIKVMDGQHATFVPDIITGDLHWPPTQQDFLEDIVPIGQWHFSFAPNTLIITGAAPDLSEAEMAYVYRSGDVVAIYIGPIFLLSDFNRDGIVEVDDIFAFLGAWFDTNYRADYDANHVVGVSDIFMFLSLWFERR
jgi:hypothetical protein